MQPTGALDWVLDKSVVGGYTRLGPALRRRWWPADPPAGALAGRHVLITGASSGLGAAAAAGLVGLGATVHLGGRNPDRLQDVRANLERHHPGADVQLAPCDVGDLDAVRSFCADFAARVPQLHALVHNAGVLPPERTDSAQGHELSLATNVLGPHLLTFLLAPTLAGGRVVVVSSGGMYGQPLTEDLEYERGDYSGTTAYARTKRMQVVLAPLWAARLKSERIGVHSMHPGWADTPGLSASLPRFASVMGPLLRSPASGADTVVWLVGTPDDLGTGRFWHDRAARSTHYLPWQRETPDQRALLWEHVVTATGVPDHL